MNLISDLTHFTTIKHLLSGQSLTVTARLTGTPEALCSQSLIWFGRYCRSLLNGEMRHLRPTKREDFLIKTGKKRVRVLVAYDAAIGLIPVFQIGYRHDPLDELLSFDLSMRSRSSLPPQHDPTSAEARFARRFADYSRGRAICEMKSRRNCTVAVRTLVRGILGSSFLACSSLDEMRAVVAAHLAYHNFCSTHEPLGTSPAHAAGLAPCRYSYQQFYDYARRRLQWAG